MIPGFFSQQAMMNALGGTIDTSDFLSIAAYVGDGLTNRLIPGVDLSAGGISWVKGRNHSNSHKFSLSPTGSTVHTADLGTSTPTTTEQSFSASGATLVTTADQNVNASLSYINFQIRKKAGMLDVISYTGNGANRTIAHSLGVVPAAIIIIRTGATGVRPIYHKDFGGTGYQRIDSTAAITVDSTYWNDTAATTSDFSLGTASAVNVTGGAYIAVVFAHDPTVGIAAFSYTGNGSSSGPTVSLGWNPRFLYFMAVDGAASAHTKIVVDTHRTPGFSGSEGATQTSTGGEASGDFVAHTGTGFQVVSASNYVNFAGQNYYGLAIG